MRNRSVNQLNLRAITAFAFHQNFVAMVSLIVVTGLTNLHVNQKAVVPRNVPEDIGHAQIMSASLTRKCVTVKQIAAMVQTKRIATKVYCLCIVCI